MLRKIASGSSLGICTTSCTCNVPCPQRLNMARWQHGSHPSYVNQFVYFSACKNLNVINDRCSLHMSVFHNSKPNSAVLKLTFTSLGPCFCLPGRSSVFHQENNSLDIGQVDVGKRVGQNVPPGVFWRSQLRLEQPRFLKFNISVQKNALIGVYGRKGLAPTHTQVRPFWKPNQKNYSFF